VVGRCGAECVLPAGVMSLWFRCCVVSRCRSKVVRCVVGAVTVSSSPGGGWFGAAWVYPVSWLSAAVEYGVSRFSSTKGGACLPDASSLLVRCGACVGVVCAAPVS
jgi:hypothetical protein